MQKIQMEQWGLTERLAAEAALYEGLAVGRVVSQYREQYRVIGENGAFLAEVSGKFRFAAAGPADFPAAGDFVLLDRAADDGGNAQIRRVLTRRSALIRRAAGGADGGQVVASNIDTAFICMSLNNDFNLRRLERYLALVWESGAVPVVVLTKADVCADAAQWREAAQSVAVGVEVLVVSGLREADCRALASRIAAGRTAAFIGSSGVGKSTLINALLGRAQLDTGGLRNDDKGRHTTTRRELILLENGGLVIDTPGMRELGLEGADLSRAFADIDALAAQCKFRDCRHNGEPGCMVRRAIEDGALSAERLRSYRKLEKEAGYEGLDSRQIESLKCALMFADAGGMKKARRFLKEKSRSRRGV